jgi:predicted Rossmann fold nucleotide-binding protein DprA/Smf involved in DNA uptake
LEFGVPTIAVVPGSVEKIVPRRHHGLAQKIIANDGLIISENSSSDYKSYQYQQRNRIIAAISPMTIVVEAPAKSGTLITAKHASQYGREVFVAFPGREKENLQGNIFLLKQHMAEILTNKMSDLRRVYSLSKDEVIQNQFYDEQLEFTPEEKSLWNKLRDSEDIRELDLDEKSRRTIGKWKLEGLVEQDEYGKIRVKI